MALRILEMFLGNMFVFAASAYVFRRLRTRVPYRDVPIFLFILLYTATLYSFILGLAGLLDPHRIAAISILGLCSLSVPALKHRQSWKKLLKAPRTSWESFKLSKSNILLLIFASLLLVRTLAHIWYIPPNFYDSMTYHLPNVAEWVQKQRIHVISTPVTRSYWPATFEVLETWFVVFLHNDIIIELASCLFYFVAGASVYAIARILGVGSFLSACATLFFLYTPSLAIHATICSTDMPAAASYLLSIAVILDLLKNGNRESFPLANRFIVVLMAQSFGLGAKAYTMFLFPGLLLLSVVAVIKHHLIKEVGHLFIPGVGPSAGKIILYTILVLGSGLLGFYWYIRNWIVFDNPFHPTDFRVLGHLVFGTGDAPQYAAGQRGSIGLMSLLENAGALATKVFDKARFSASLGSISGWGWFSFAAGIPALLYTAIFGRGFYLLTLCFILSLTVLFAGISVDPWNMRFTLWFPAIFAISFAVLVANLSGKWVRALLIGFAMMCSILNFIAVLNNGDVPPPDFRRMMAMPPLSRSIAEMTHRNVGAYRDTLSRVPRNEIIGYNVDNNEWIYPLYDSDLSRRLMYVPIGDLSFIDFMKQNGINYLYVGKTGENERKLIVESLRKEHLGKITWYLYALK